ncbi:MAG: carboxylating nicotinate-nucleotide diphosphorylase [Rickettsiaceae bacterium]
MNINLIAQYIDNALQEDLGIGCDITSKLLLQEDDVKGEFQIIAKEDGVLCGVEIVSYILNKYSNAKYELFRQDGFPIKQKQIIAQIIGDAKEILMLERVMLNYLQHLSGIATLTRKYVDAANGKAKICDTRKTIPGLRMLQKYAVRCGGGYNHRLALDSSILIKDNHIALSGNKVSHLIKQAKKRAPHYTKIEVECDNLELLPDIVQAKPDIIMLDNMNIDQIKHAVKIINKIALIDVSGGVTLDNIPNIINCNIDFISIGRLTNSSQAIDISMECSFSS